ncbi:MAG: choice-of-anchor tandem repeat NxxGxxAF-containing protein [Verrucomicrobiota bacterium]
MAASGAAPTLIARTGSQAPGLDAGIVFADFVKFAGFALGQVPILNDLDQVLFAAQLRGPGVTATNDLSLWLAGNNAGPQLVAREGDLAPGTSSPTARFASVTSPPALNDKGQVAFYALLTGIVASNNVAIYLGKPGDLQILTHSGAAFSTADGYSGHINGISRFYAGLGSPHGGHGAGLSENGGVLLQTSLILQKPFVESRNAVVLVAMGSTTTSDSFRILSVSKTGNDVAILFASSPGKHYTLEYNEQLAAGGWASLAGETAATAAETTITDSSDPKGAHRFYRVRQL